MKLKVSAINLIKTFYIKFHYCVIKKENYIILHRKYLISIFYPKDYLYMSICRFLN